MTTASRVSRLRPLAALGFLAMGCRAGGGQADAGKSPEAEAIVNARTIEVTAGTFTETLSAIGTVAARAGHVATLSAPAPTRIARVFVATGQHVRRGAPLIQLEQATFRASARSAEAALVAAERAHDRADRLVQAGIAPRKDLDQAEADLARARADVIAARRAEELSVLRAPIEGVVTRMTAVLGASVDANQPLVEVTDPSALDIVLEVTPAEAARIRPQATVELRAGQGGDGAPLGTATVADVGGAVDSATRTVAVRARATTVTRPLRIGETVFGRVVVGVHPGALTVPVEALVPDGDGFKVFVVDGRGVAHSRPVVVGGRSDSLVEISRGLSAGERVVTAGAYGVEDSAKVIQVGP